MKFGTWAHILSPTGTINAFRSVIEAKMSFRRSINAIFGKVVRIASEEVIPHLVKTKCLPILLYGLECYPLNKADTDLSILQSHDFDENV